MKELIITWSQTYVNAPGDCDWMYWGIGDMLRGTLFLFRLGKKRGYKITVDTHLHPLSTFTTHSKSEHSEFIEKTQEKIWFFEKKTSHDIEHEIDCAEWIENSKLFCMCNHGTEQRNQVITQEEQEFLKSIIEPTLDVQTEIDQLVSTLPENYTVLHVRFLDNNTHSQKNVDKFKRIKKPTDIGLSNSLSFKRQLGVPFINRESGHIGYEQDLEKIKNSFIEFHIMANSKEIRTYSEYSWISGYALWAGKIYDVPIADIKQEIKNSNRELNVFF